MSEEAAVPPPPKRKPGRPRKNPLPTGAGFTPPLALPSDFTKTIPFAARRVIQAMTKRVGALPSAQALTAAAAQMEQTSAALRWMAANGIPADMLAAPPPPVPPAPVADGLSGDASLVPPDEPADGDVEPVTKPKRRGRRPGYRPPPSDVVCESCGVYGHDDEHCPETA